MNSERILTKLCYKLIDDNYLDKNGKVKDDLKFRINIPDLGIINSKIPAKEGEKFDTYLFLPEGEGRKGEGGLRTKGYFKFNYIKNKEDNKWWISDFLGNPLIPAPEDIQQQINLYIAKNKDLSILNIEQLPLITVITVVYNGEKYLEETINSIINQNYLNIEYIIIDGGSTDGTLYIIKRYEDYIDYWISEKDNGIYDAMNKGLIVAWGNIVGFLNSDDFYTGNNVIEAVINEFIRNNVDCVYGDLIYIDVKNVNNVIRYWKSQTFTEGLFKKGWHPPHPAFFVKRECYKKYGFFNVDFKIAADYELMLRFLEKYKIKSSYVNKVIVKMRIGGESNKSIINIIRANIECYKAWKINGLNVCPLIIFYKPISKVKQLLIK